MGEYIATGNVDVDGDGKPDVVDVYAEGADLVYVADTDGDGVADLELLDARSDGTVDGVYLPEEADGAAADEPAGGPGSGNAG